MELYMSEHVCASLVKYDGLNNRPRSDTRTQARTHAHAHKYTSGCMCLLSVCAYICASTVTGKMDVPENNQHSMHKKGRCMCVCLCARMRVQEEECASACVSSVLRLCIAV